MNKIVLKSYWKPFTKFSRAVSKWLLGSFHRETCSSRLCPAGIFALAKLPCGMCATVKVLNLAHDEAEKLRRLGIREGCRISMISGNDPMLVLVENTRIALSHRLTPRIQIQGDRGNMLSES